MKRAIITLCVVGFMLLPAAGAMAKVGQGKQPVGNGKLQVPPGLVNAEQKILDKISAQIEALDARFLAASAALYDAIDQAIDPVQAAELQAELDSLIDRYDALSTKLHERWFSVKAAFDAKILAWKLKHGIPIGEELPPY